MDKPAVKKVPLFRSLQLKYALAYLVVIALVLLLMNTYPIIASQDQVFKSKQTSLQTQANVLSSSLGVADILTPEGVAQAMEVLGDSSLARVLVTDPAGLILYDSAGEENVYRYALFSELAGALSGRDVSRSGYRDGSFSTRAAAPITYRNLTIGAVYLWEEDPEQGALLMNLRTTLLNISMVICILVILCSIFFSKALTRRIEDLLQAIAIVRNGQYNHRVELVGRDELSLLADEFNNLTDRLQVTEEVRRRFVSDASHELKTPLASIRLLTDSILQSPEIDPETTREFVSDIGAEADRLTRISEKLLALTRLDSAVEPVRCPVAVSAVVDKVARMLAPLAQAGDVTLKLELDPACVVFATEDDLSQIAFNLMENAVKYNRPGGEVLVAASHTESRAILQVTDTGVGIPEADRSKIFDRFYRVDKARSRAAGGTGLGLSIVLDTVKQHQGTVTVESTLGAGSHFTVSFPLCKEEVAE